MHISNFLIAVISTAAIAKPLPYAQAGSPFGYFPSDFGAQELYNSIKQWRAPAVLQRPEGGNSLPDGTVEGDYDIGNPSLVTNSPAIGDPKSYHQTMEHPPGISPSFRYFREFWCGAFEGREQSVCCLGNEYGNFRPFAGELACEKKQWVLGAGTETITIMDRRFLRYCHESSYLYSCDDYYVGAYPISPVSPLPRSSERIHNMSLLPSLPHSPALRQANELGGWGKEFIQKRPMLLRLPTN